MRRQALGRANTIIIVTAIFFATAPFIVAGYYIVGIYRLDQQQKAEAARQAQEAEVLRLEGLKKRQELVRKIEEARSNPSSPNRAVIGILELELALMPEYASSEPYFRLDGLLSLINVILVLIIIVPVILIFIFAPALASAPLALFLIFTWRRPYNIVLLRPFFSKESSSALTYLVKWGLAGLGHFYTLSDRHIRQKWYIVFPILLGQLSFLHFRFEKVRSRKTADKLCRTIRQRRRRIFNWAVSYSRIFPIACADRQWQYTITRLLSDVDLILIDITGNKNNIRWEIQECKRLGLMEKVIFIAYTAGAGSPLEVVIGDEVVKRYEVVPYGRCDTQEVREIMELMISKILASASYTRHPPAL